MWCKTPRPRVAPGILAPATLVHSCSSTPGSHDVGTTPEADVQSFRVLLTPLAYIHVGHIDIETCGGPVKSSRSRHPASRSINASMHVIACIEDPVVSEKILIHLERKDAVASATRLLPSRARPRSSLFT